jgi:oligoendopeptidase F
VQSVSFSPEKWDLSDALPRAKGDSSRQMPKTLDSELRMFEAVRKGLGAMKKEELRSAITLYESINEEVSRITSSAFMRYTADTRDQKAKASLDWAEEIQAEIANRSLFFRLWWTTLSQQKALRLMPEERDYQYFLATWRKLKPHTLEENVEKVVNIKNTTGILGWSHHYDKMTSAFVFELKGVGRKYRGKSMVADEVSRLFASPDGSVREAAYRALLEKYSENCDILGEIYRTIVRDWRNENVVLRGYKSPISPRNLENDVPDKSVATLLDVCRRNVAVFQDFFAMKAKILGIGKMKRYHIYAPLGRKERKFTFADAVGAVASAFEEFDNRVSELAIKTFEKRHVDATPRRGKRNGAYCMSVIPSVIPYLFLNFAGTARDVYTIAHESGHAVHSQMSSSHSVLTFQPPLVLAETASVFGEMILFDKMMRDEEDEEVKKQLLMDRISSIYANIGRQAHFVIFEIAAHEAVRKGATVQDLGKLYLTNLRTQFGPSIEVSEDFMWEWTYIPHIYHTPFYCYAYAFGNLLSLALYQTYLKEGRSFVPKYLRLLSYGGSESPQRVLDEVGADLSSPRFWQSGFDVIGRMVSDLRML